MRKVIDFIKEWWKVMASGIIILLQLFCFGCALHTAETSAWAGIPAIFGSVIVIVICVAFIIKVVGDKKRKKA